MARACPRTRRSIQRQSDTATLRGLPRVKVASAWVPWTHRRLTTSSGYGAGVDSPGWYRHVFDHPGSDGVARFFVDAAHLLRAQRPVRVARPSDRRNPARRRACDDAWPTSTRSGRGARCRRCGDGRARSRAAELVVGDALGQVPDSAAAGAARTGPGQSAEVRTPHTGSDT